MKLIHQVRDYSDLSSSTQIPPMPTPLLPLIFLSQPTIPPPPSSPFQLGICPLGNSGLQTGGSHPLHLALMYTAASTCPIQVTPVFWMMVTLLLQYFSAQMTVWALWGIVGEELQDLLDEVEEVLRECGGFGKEGESVYFEGEISPATWIAC